MAEDFFDPEDQTGAPKKKKAAASKKPVKTKAKTAAAAPSPQAPAPAPRQAAPKNTAVRVDRAKEHLTADAQISDADNRKMLAADIERIRKMRKPFGAMTQKLAIAGRAGYHRHWFNDDPGRVDEARNNGWAHVTKNGEPVKRVVGRGRDNGALYAYCMELPTIFWQEDMQARHDAAQARIDEIRKTPFRAPPGMAQRSDAGKFYDPTESGVVKIKQTMARAPVPDA